MRSKVGIIGVGFVGRAVANGFAATADVLCWDEKPVRCTAPFNDVLAADCIFVCVPTPRDVVDGSCDTSIVEGVIEQIAVEGNREANVAIKSTVPPGTTEALARRLDMRGLVHCPEFLSARSAIADFLTQTQVFIGAPSVVNVDRVWAHVFKERFPGIPVIVRQARETELLKYMCNCYGATAVSFFNEMYAIAAALGVDYGIVVNDAMRLGRMPRDYFRVPGPDGKFGFGGACFPKDLDAAIQFAIKAGADPVVLDGVKERNQIARER